MFHFAWFASRTYGFSAGWRRVTGAGLLHSETPGSEAACAYPGTIAACRVLRRPLPPRHPSCARTACPPNPFGGRPPRAAAAARIRCFRLYFPRAGTPRPGAVISACQFLHATLHVPACQRAAALGPRTAQCGCVASPRKSRGSLIKGGDPAAGSPTATLLRLHPSR